MAQRDLTNYNRVTDVVADNTGGELSGLAAVADFGNQLMKQRQEAYINESLASAQLDIAKLQNQYQIDYESNPEAGLKDYQAQRKAIFDRYAEGVSPFLRTAWNDEIRKMSQQNDMVQQGWAMKQTRTNTINSVNSSMKASFMLANQNGAQFGKDPSAELSALMDFETSRARLEEFGNRNLGAETTAKALEDFNRDYMKSFVSGVLTTNPERAASLLQDDAIKSAFTPSELEDIGNSIKSQQRRIQIEGERNSVNGGFNALDLVQSLDGNQFEKRLQIDMMEASGQIKSRTATQARRVLSSQAAVDAVTDTDKTADFIKRVYDLNSIADSKQSDYLVGVQNLNDELLEMQANGEVSAPDAQKLRQQIGNLTNAKASEATTSIASTGRFRAISRRFDAELPQQYRGEAIREMFYKTHGRNDLTQEATTKIASDIIDGIRNRERERALDIANRVRTARVQQPQRQSAGVDFATEALLSRTVNPITNQPFTMDDVRETADKYGMTEEQVIEEIRSMGGAD